MNSKLPEKPGHFVPQFEGVQRLITMLEQTDSAISDCDLLSGRVYESHLADLYECIRQLTPWEPDGVKWAEWMIRPYLSEERCLSHTELGRVVVHASEKDARPLGYYGAKLITATDRNRIWSSTSKTEFWENSRAAIPPCLFCATQTQPHSSYTLLITDCFWSPEAFSSPFQFPKYAVENLMMWLSGLRFREIIYSYYDAYAIYPKHAVEAYSKDAIIETKSLSPGFTLESVTFSEQSPYHPSIENLPAITTYANLPSNRSLEGLNPERKVHRQLMLRAWFSFRKNVPAVRHLFSLPEGVRQGGITDPKKSKDLDSVIKKFLQEAEVIVRLDQIIASSLDRQSSSRDKLHRLLMQMPHLILPKPELIRGCTCGKR